jgi:hypothetical protein
MRVRILRDLCHHDQIRQKLASQSPKKQPTTQLALSLLPALSCVATKQPSTRRWLPVQTRAETCLLPTQGFPPPAWLALLLAML